MDLEDRKVRQIQIPCKVNCGIANLHHLWSLAASPPSKHVCKPFLTSARIGKQKKKPWSSLAGDNQCVIKKTPALKLWNSLHYKLHFLRVGLNVMVKSDYCVYLCQSFCQSAHFSRCCCCAHGMWCRRSAPREVGILSELAWRLYCISDNFSCAAAPTHAVFDLARCMKCSLAIRLSFKLSNAWEWDATTFLSKKKNFEIKSFLYLLFWSIALGWFRKLFLYELEKECI